MALLMAVAVGGIDLMFGASVKHQFDSNHYPQAAGVIVQSRVYYYQADHSRSRAIVEYAYEVNGLRYTSRRYKFLSDKPAGDIVARFPVGAQVPVFYNPQDPSLAVLSPGLDEDGREYVYFVLAMNAVALILILFVWKKYDNGKHAAPGNHLKATRAQKRPSSR